MNKIYVQLDDATMHKILTEDTIESLRHSPQVLSPKKADDLTEPIKAVSS